ncbi:hypothetical protein C8F01DRAFT_1336230 [Mycena amicta]|nr:hypothetical protein C8F01DRAFT_1336230 [Mycena amicta]
MSSPSYPCRWKWCRSILKSTSELREHIRDHVRDEKSCRVRELVEQLRAEEGIGQSISLGLGSYSQVSLQGSGSSTRPVLPPASTSSLANALSPPAQYIVSPGPETTPRISQIASRSTSAIPNPEIPDLDTLLSGALSVPNKQLFSTPVSSPSRLRISRSQDSDSSVERQLTQEMDMSFDVAIAIAIDVLVAVEPSNSPPNCFVEQTVLVRIAQPHELAVSYTSKVVHVGFDKDAFSPQNRKSAPSLTVIFIRLVIFLCPSDTSAISKPGSTIMHIQSPQCACSYQT